MSFVRLLTVAVIGLALFQVCCRKVDGTKGPTVALVRADFHGWEAIALRNQMAEVIVVPAIGRIMEFRLRPGPKELRGGPFWSHPGIGTALAPDDNGWLNYGGDK